MTAYEILPYVITAIAILTRKDLAIMAASTIWMGEAVWIADMDFHSTLLGFASLNLILCVASASHYFDHKDQLSVSVSYIALSALIINFLQAIGPYESGLQFLTMHLSGLLGWLLVIVLITQDGRRKLVDDAAHDLHGCFNRHFRHSRHTGSNGGGK